MSLEEWRKAEEMASDLSAVLDDIEANNDMRDDLSSAVGRIISSIRDYMAVSS